MTPRPDSGVGVGGDLVFGDSNGLFYAANATTVDPDEWDITATTVEAGYARSMNSLYIPAGIIPPFFDSAADPAVDFGGIGVVAAHELTHGFDDLGLKFDDRGSVRDWRTSDDRKEFAGAAS